VSTNSGSSHGQNSSFARPAHGSAEPVQAQDWEANREAGEGSEDH